MSRFSVLQAKGTRNGTVAFCGGRTCRGREWEERVDPGSELAERFSRNDFGWLRLGGRGVGGGGN